MERLNAGDAGRYEVVTEEGPAHGDLYELEQTTYYHVVDRQLDRVVISFEGTMEASLSRETGLWDDYHFSGVCEVSVVPGEWAVYVKYCNGHEEFIPLPG
jgi:hypothetical protein